MPDHIAEFLASAKGKQAVATVVLEEHRGEIDDAVIAEKRRTESAWGDRREFALLDERSLAAGSHSGTLLVYRWRASPTTPAWIYYRALLPFEERVVLALAESVAAADGDGGKRSRDEDAIMALIQSIDCTKR